MGVSGQRRFNLSSAKIRLGIIGIGFGQQVHVPAFRADPRCEVAAVCASTQERANQIATKLGIPRAFGDWRELVDDPNIDAISLATPPSLQATIALVALHQHKHVFAEKPLAHSHTAALELVGAAEQAGVANMLDLEFPEIAEWQQAKTILDSGSLGPLRHITVTWNVETYANRHKLNSWKTSLEAGGGTLYSFVSHSFDYLEWLVGPIKRISANLWHTPDDTRTGDTLDTLTLELESGVPVALTVSSAAFLGNGHRLEFYGEQGTLVLANPTLDYVNGFQVFYGNRQSNRLDLLSPPQAVIPGNDGRVAVVGAVVKRFVDWIDTGSPAKPSFKEGLRVQTLLETALQSNERQAWVTVGG